MFETIAMAMLPSLAGGISNQISGSQNFGNTKYLNRVASDRKRKDDKTARQFSLRLLKEERAYNDKNTIKDRAYAEGQTQNERDYIAKRLAEDRAYSRTEGDRDRDLYEKDRDFMQGRSDRYARATAKSRGIDFTKLVSDARAAGINPMTAMSMAGAYSTEVGYQPQGGVYNNGPAFFNSGAGYGTGGGGSGGGGAVQSTPSIGAGGSVSSGGGYGSGGTQMPSMSSGSFVADAVARGVDTYFNETERLDSEAEAIRQQVQDGYTRRRIMAETPGQNFGFDMSKVVPFQPQVGAITPVLGKDAFHNRDLDVEPTRDTPITTMYDVGHGKKVRGLNPDLDSELANTVNAGYVYGRAALEDFKQSWINKTVNGFFSKTGAEPTSPLFKAKDYRVTPMPTGLW